MSGPRPGWYWWREDGRRHWTIVEITELYGVTLIDGDRWDRITELWPSSQIVRVAEQPPPRNWKS